MGPFALGPAFHHAGFAKDLHVMRQGGLTDLQILENLASALFSAAEHVDDQQPILITEGFEDHCLVRISLFIKGLFHFFASNLFLSM
jgi:hypothetical protein